MKTISIKRKGAVRRSDVSARLRGQLNRGEVEALTLAEILTVDFAELMKHAFPSMSVAAIKKMHAAKDQGWVGRTRLAGEILHDEMSKNFKRMLVDMRNHPSDQVRGWGASLVAAASKVDLQERLALTLPFADDPNPGTRETAWIMLRPHIASNLKDAFRMLKPLTKHDSANLRRFASEITRPRGVWCTYIPTLRENPSLGLPILTPLRADPSRYVQNSVANWLNDASKDDPDFVRKLCRDWLKQEQAPTTAYICRRAQRTLNKKD